MFGLARLIKYEFLHILSFQIKLVIEIELIIIMLYSLLLSEIKFITNTFKNHFKNFN